MIVVFCHFFWFMSQVPILVSEWTDIGLRFSKSFGITKEVSGTLFYVGDCFLLSSIQLVFDHSALEANGIGKKLSISNFCFYRSGRASSLNFCKN